MPNIEQLRERLFGTAFKDLASKSDVGRITQVLIKALTKAVRDLEERIDKRLARIKDGRDGYAPRKGLDYFDGQRGERGERGERGPVGYGLDGRDGRDGKDGKDGSPDTPVQVRDKLEKLKGDERLDKSAVRGLEEAIAGIKEVRVERRGIFGRSLLQLYVDGSKKGAIQYFNLVAGNNVSLTYSYANGRNDVVISATGGSGSFSILTATGSVNDSNTIFTFASEPVLVVVNGVSYRHGHGVTISTTTATLDNPAGTGGDVYGVG